MLENEWLYDRAWENGLKEGIKRGKALAYKEVLNILPQEYEIKECDFCDYSRIDSAITEINQLADKCNKPEATDPIPHEELTNSRLFHHIRASHLEKILDRFLQDKDHDPDFPLFNCTEAEKEKQSILALLEKKGLPKVTQIYLYASLDVIDFYVRKAHEYMKRCLRSPTDKFLADIDIEIFIQEIGLEIQMAKTTSLRIENDYPNF